MLPLAHPVVRSAHAVLWKGDGLFTHARQVGLAWEQHYEYYHTQGQLEDGDVNRVTLEGGDLWQLKAGRWYKVKGAEVPLSPKHREFARKQVFDDDDMLNSLGLRVLAVDVPAPEVDGSHDLLVSFRRGKPIPGKLSLEHKFVFGKNEDFQAHVGDFKAKFKKRLENLEGVKGQVLLVTHLDDTNRLRVLDTAVLWTDGTRWRTLTPTPATSARSFAAVWEECAGRRHGPLVLKEVCEFLRRAGKDPRRAGVLINKWSDSGIGVRKDMFKKLPVPTGRGTGNRERHYASRATLLKVWPALISRRVRRH
jgi:hypothetical protein